MGLLRAFWPLLFVCLVTGYLLRALLPSPELSLSHVGILFFLVAVVAGILLAWGDRRLGNFLKGAKGEEWVAHELSFLSAEYTVFNGLGLGGGKQSFDHIVVGPSGVFVVETKTGRAPLSFEMENSTPAERSPRARRSSRSRPPPPSWSTFSTIPTTAEFPSILCFVLSPPSFPKKS